MIKLTSCLLILLCFASPSGLTSPDPAANPFVGAWRLLSIEGAPPGRPGIYDHPVGQLIYDPSGQVSAQVVLKADRSPFGRNPSDLLAASAEQKAAAFDTYLAYFGIYRVDSLSGTVHHHIQQHLIPGRSGAEIVRWYEFRDKDHLLLIPMEDGNGGVLDRKKATYKLLWERVK